MASEIETLIASGSILIIDYSGSLPSSDPDNSITQGIIDNNQLTGGTVYDSLVAQLEYLYAESAEFRRMMGELSPTDALILSVGLNAGSQMGAHITGSNPWCGIAWVGTESNIAFLAEDGTKRDMPWWRVIGHELAHAIDGVYDPTANLSGSSSTPRSAYQGAAVVTENLIASQVYDTDAWGRTSYASTFGSLRSVDNSLSVLKQVFNDSILSETSLTMGYVIDLVIIDDYLNNTDPNKPADPGKDIDTSNNIAHVSDLIVSSGTWSSNIKTGAGSDWVYAADGVDTITGGSDDDFLFGEGDGDFLYGGSDNDWLFGGAGDDELYGGDNDDVLHGGAGSDKLNGGDGDDTIYFDELDSEIRGGEGRDVAILTSTNLVHLNVDMSGPAQIEVLIAGTGNDVITTGGSGSFSIAGGEGDDVFNITADAGSLSIVSGGAGNDIFNLTWGEGRTSNFGIYFYSDPDITEEEFIALTPTQISSTVDWSAFDLIIVNPDSGDRLQSDGNTMGTDYIIPFGAPGGTFLGIEYSSEFSAVGRAGFADVNFLGAGVSEVFTAIANPNVSTHAEYIDGNDVHFIDLENYANEDGEFELWFGTVTLDDIDAAGEWSTPEGSSMEQRGIAFYLGEDHFAFSSPSDFQTFYIANGYLSGETLMLA